MLPHDLRALLDQRLADAERLCATRPHEALLALSRVREALGLHAAAAPGGPGAAAGPEPAGMAALPHAELLRLHRRLLAADVEKTRLLERLAAQSRTNALTGLANRRHLDERLAEAHALARRQGRALSVAMADLDDFKRINDRLGHATGDAVLRRVAALLRAHCRATDLVARYGGEEFCLVFFDADAPTAARAAAVLAQRVAAHDWAALHPRLRVTLSVGLSDRLHTLTHEGLLADADRHLYEAKRHGKNRVRWQDGEIAVAPRASAA